jgi:uncharacterized membrane protein YfcA
VLNCLVLIGSFELSDAFNSFQNASEHPAKHALFKLELNCMSSAADESISTGAVIVACISILLGSFVQALTGFGSGIIFQVLWIVWGKLGVAGAGNLQASTGLLSLTSIISLALVTYDTVKHYKNTILWRQVAALVPGVLAMSWLGAYALANADQSILKKCLGIFFLTVAINRLITSFNSYRKKLRGGSSHLPVLGEAAEQFGAISENIEIDANTQQLNHNNTAIAATSKINGKFSPIGSSELLQEADTSNSQGLTVPYSSRCNSFIVWLRSPDTIIGLITGVFAGFLNGAFATGGE